MSKVMSRDVLHYRKLTDISEADKDKPREPPPLMDLEFLATGRLHTHTHTFLYHLCKIFSSHAVSKCLSNFYAILLTFTAFIIHSNGIPCVSQYNVCVFDMLIHDTFPPAGNNTIMPLFVDAVPAPVCEGKMVTRKGARNKEEPLISFTGAYGWSLVCLIRCVSMFNDQC